MMLPDALNSAIRSGRNGPLNMISVNKAEPPGTDWKSFTITAADTGNWIGYTNGDIAVPPFNPPMGLIDGQPADGLEVDAIYQDAQTHMVSMILHGDHRDIAVGLSLTINGETRTMSNTGLIYGGTMIEFPDFSLTIEDGKQYTCLISQ